MWYEVLIPAPVLMIPILVMTTKGTHSTNDTNLHSDVIVTYSNHTEASNDDKILTNPEPVSVVETTTGSTHSPAPDTVPLDDNKSSEVEKLHTVKKAKKKKNHMKKHEKIEPVQEEEPVQEDVVFIPNEKDDRGRNDYYSENENTKVSDLMGGGHQTIQDMLANKDIRLETESPVSDIIFVLGKNNENIDNADKTKDQKGRDDQIPNREDSPPTPTLPPLDCSNLNCNNTIDSICGRKIEANHKIKYRLFLNDCFFRKVNCYFKDPANRYRRVSLDKCNNAAAHAQAPFSFSYKPMHSVQKATAKATHVNRTRKTTSSRRSMTTDMQGAFCSHPCPASCSDAYAPECAVTSTGRRRVFVNHCALDHNSCSFGIVWHTLPLAECVGDKKAEMRQSAGFIGWMQRVGIVDSKGRLAFNAQ